jgi:hypothetical protein
MTPRQTEASVTAERAMTDDDVRALSRAGAVTPEMILQAVINVARTSGLPTGANAIAALRAAGWAVVPVVATEAMIDAGDAEASTSIGDGGGWSNDYSAKDLPAMWAAMLAAAERTETGR